MSRVGPQEVADALTAANMNGNIEAWLAANDVHEDAFRDQLHSFVEMLVEGGRVKPKDEEQTLVAVSLGFMIGFEAAKASSAVDQLLRELGD